MRTRQTGFTMLEALIVLVIVVVLAASVIPRFRTSSEDAFRASAEFQLKTMRSQLALYKSQHRGQVPSDLRQLTGKTDTEGNVGKSPEHRFGPYLLEIPLSPLHGNNGVVRGNGSNVAGDGEAWQYDAVTGQLWVNHTAYLGQPAD